MRLSPGVIAVGAILGIIFSSGCGGGAPAGGGAVPIVPIPGPSSPPIVNALRISTDPFTNASSQHQTQVEPDAFAFGPTIVAAFQSGRFFSGGSSDIGFSVSHDAGMTWSAGSLPGTTIYASPAGPFNRVSDPAVVYDAAHALWMISSLPILDASNITPAVLVNRSTDGFSWGLPVSVAPGQNAPDKDWITCDNTATSPYYGHCYVEWDENGLGNLIHMSTSLDGGLTWSAPANTANNATGLGGQPLVQQSGRVIVPIDDANEARVLSFVSVNGGASWSSAVLAAGIVDHGEAGGLRSGPLISAAMDGAGRIYTVWQDCRFEAACSANDIVLSTSLDGLSWTVPVRIPIDPIGSGVDHFIPGVGVDLATSGGGAHLALTYYYYPVSNCTAATCALFVGIVSSPDGGASWSAPVTLAGPMNLGWLAQTSQGTMVGDYIATVFAAGHPTGVFAVAQPPAGTTFNEATYASHVTIFQSLALRHTNPAEPVLAAKSDHALHYRRLTW